MNKKLKLLNCKSTLSHIEKNNCLYDWVTDLSRPEIVVSLWVLGGWTAGIDWDWLYWKKRNLRIDYMSCAEFLHFVITTSLCVMIVTVHQEWSLSPGAWIIIREGKTTKECKASCGAVIVQNVYKCVMGRRKERELICIRKFTLLDESVTKQMYLGLICFIDCYLKAML